MELVSITITDDEFYEKYRPVSNHLDDNSSFDGKLFETYGEEINYCFELSKKQNRVWTIIECDDEDYDGDGEQDDIFDLENQEDGYEPPMCLQIINGFHYVNRIGFMVTEVPYNENEDITVKFT